MSTEGFATARERFMWALARCDREAFEGRRLEFHVSLDYLETLQHERPREYDHTPESFCEIPIIVIPGLGKFTLHENPKPQHRQFRL